MSLNLLFEIPGLEVYIIILLSCYWISGSICTLLIEIFSEVLVPYLQFSKSVLFTQLHLESKSIINMHSDFCLWLNVLHINWVLARLQPVTMQLSGIRRLTSSNNSHLTSNVLLPTSNTFLLVHTVHRSVPSERYCGPTPNPSELGCQASLALARSCWQRVKTAALSDPTFTWHKLVGRLPTNRTAGCRLLSINGKSCINAGE